MNRPDLIWLKFKPKEKDRLKGFVLISSWTIAVILFGVVKLYGQEAQVLLYWLLVHELDLNSSFKY